jgi:hypothetical protein
MMAIQDAKMWTAASRKHYEGKGNQKKRYPTDLSDEEWEKSMPFVPEKVAPDDRAR